MLVSYCPARAGAKIAAVAPFSSTFHQDHDLLFGASAEILEMWGRHRFDHPSLPREQVQGVFQARHVELAFELLVARPDHLVFLEPGGAVCFKRVCDFGMLRRSYLGIG